MKATRYIMLQADARKAYVVHVRIKRFQIGCFLLAISFLIPGVPAIHGQANSAEAASCQKFVQQFYDWYVVMDARNEKTNEARTTMDIALRLKPELFDQTLLQMLRADSKAQAKADEIVGLDFDPFSIVRTRALNSKWLQPDIPMEPAMRPSMACANIPDRSRCTLNCGKSEVVGNLSISIMR